MTTRSTLLKPLLTSAQEIKESLIQLFFPSFCLHCQEEIRSTLLLCPFCSEWIFLRKDPQEGPWSEAVEAEGPALSLLHARKGFAEDRIAQAMAAWMIVRWQALGWQMPDYILPSPQDKKFNAKLARYCSLFLGVPVAKKNEDLCDQIVLMVDAHSSLSMVQKDPYFLLQAVDPKEVKLLAFCRVF